MCQPPVLVSHPSLSDVDCLTLPKYDHFGTGHHEMNMTTLFYEKRSKEVSRHVTSQSSLLDLDQTRHDLHNTEKASILIYALHQEFSQVKQHQCSA